MLSPPIGVLLVSYESYGGSHQRLMYEPAFRANPACRIVAVADEPEAPEWVHNLNRQEAERLNVPYIPDLQIALQTPGVYAASVCCGFDRRLRVVRQIVQRGKALLIDKPLALDLLQAKQIVEAAEEAGVVAMCALHVRFDSSIEVIQRLVRKGELGLPWAVHVNYLISTGTQVWQGGELLNFGPYVIDMIRFITGAEVRKVVASTKGAFYSQASGEPEDFAFLSMTLEHGIIATASVGRTPYRHHLNGYNGDRQLRILGSHGTLFADLIRPCLRVTTAEGTSIRYYGGSSVQLQINHFVNCLLGIESPRSTLRDALAALAVIEAARRSATTRRAEEVLL